MLKKARMPLATKKLIKNAKKDYQKAINAFLSGEVGKFGKYLAVENALVYRTIITENYGKQQDVGQEIIARRINDLYIGNSSILKLIGMRSSFGNRDMNRQVADVQTELSALIPMVPFTVFDEAGLDLTQMQIIERGPEQTIKRKIDNPKYVRYDRDEMKKKNIPEFIIEDVHFTGASLYQIEDKHFLFDIDREEIKHKIFNPFLAEIPNNPTSIENAYQLLKPQDVLNAEKQGKTILRQGEWFFIEQNDLIVPNDVEVFGDIDKNKMLKNNYDHKTFELRAGNNRPNTAQVGVSFKDNSYVQGRVQHEGREHRDIVLKGWFRVVPNTSVNSFTIEGDID